MKMSVVCSKLASTCKRHESYRSKSRPRYEPGYYRAFQGHGQVGGPFYSESHMEEIRAKEQADLRDAIDGQHNKQGFK